MSNEYWKMKNAESIELQNFEVSIIQFSILISSSR